MSDLLVIGVSDNKWTEILNNSKKFDFYHTQSYHLLEKENQPVLFVMVFENDFVALPLIIRKIPNSIYFDCTSAYGYCGPVSNLDFEAIPNEYFAIFQGKLINYFKKGNIVTVFSRLHPLISSGAFFNNLGLVKNINKTVAIDLRNSLESQKKQYRKSNKSELNQLRRKGFEVKIASCKDDIDKFVEIYDETMNRVEANDSYFFDKEYFYNFLENPCFQTKLLLAIFDNNIVAGAIFTITNKIMQYHLAGTKEKYIKVAPMKLLLDEARLLGSKLGLDYLHLGGGVGGSDEDSLFRFKSGFSKLRCQYKVWQMIVDYEKYNELVNLNNLNKKSEFFPLYRA